jgi:large subunit ribosomal protein L14e
MTLTQFRLEKLPRGGRTGTVQKHMTTGGIVEKWNKSKWATKRAAVEKRRSLNDFERFKTLVAKKARRDVVRKSVKGAKKA